MGAGNRPHGQDDRGDHERRRHDGRRPSDLAPTGNRNHSGASCDEDEKEGPDELGEEPSPFVGQVVEVPEPGGLGVHDAVDGDGPLVHLAHLGRFQRSPRQGSQTSTRNSGVRC
jgi:hypothetical protein